MCVSQECGDLAACTFRGLRTVLPRSTKMIPAVFSWLHIPRILEYQIDKRVPSARASKKTKHCPMTLIKGSYYVIRRWLGGGSASRHDRHDNSSTTVMLLYSWRLFLTLSPWACSCSKFWILSSESCCGHLRNWVPILISRDILSRL